MPEQRLAKTRATLPEGYQFGDAAHPEWMPWKPSGLLAMSKAIDASIVRMYDIAPARPYSFGPPLNHKHGYVSSK